VTAAPVVGTTSQPRLTPYISNAMFAADARRGVSVDNLVPRGSPPDNDAALSGYIESASGWMDSICQQILAATYDTQGGRVNVSRDGYVYVHPRYRPVIALAAFSIGATPAAMAAYTSLSGVNVQPDHFAVPMVGGGNLPVMTDQGAIQFSRVGSPWDQAWAEWIYVNGFPVTSLSASAAAGATQIEVDDTTGIVEGKTWLVVYSGAKRHRFLAGQVSTAGSDGIGTGPGSVACSPLPAAQVNEGPHPLMVSALPPDAIQACVLATRAFIKDAGAGNISGASAQGEPTTPGDDLAEAARLLRNYVAPVS
jgi:hypothetical protein